MSIEKRLERLEAILDARGLDWDHPRVAEEPAKEPPKKWRILEPGEVVCSSDWVKAKSDFLSDPPSGLGWRPVEISAGITVYKDDFCVFARLVSDEPAKEREPKHPAGPKPDPGEGYRILSKNPPEELQEGDELQCVDGTWGASDNARTHKRQASRIWYRRKIETAEPAWEPKVGDWVRVTRPENWGEWKDPLWREEMHIYDGKVMQVARYEQRYGAWVANFYEHGWFFHRDWLSPAEPPAIDKPPEPEYREPVLPADAGKVCEFSIDGNAWTEAKLRGYAGHLWQSVCSEVVGAKHWVHARIKKDA